MAKTLDEYKKEFKELDERASRLEAEIQKAEAQKEMLLKQLKDEFSIESIESIQTINVSTNWSIFIDF